MDRVTSAPRFLFGMVLSVDGGFLEAPLSPGLMPFVLSIAISFWRGESGASFTAFSSNISPLPLADKAQLWRTCHYLAWPKIKFSLESVS
jgi:hypothetical protein